MVPWGHPGSPSEQQEGHVVVWTRNLSDFVTIWELHFDRFLNIFFSKLVSRSLFVAISVSNAGCLGLPKQGFRMEGIAKINFSQELNSGDIKPHFSCSLGVLRDTFYDFWCHGSTLEMSWFFRVARRDP